MADKRVVLLMADVSSQETGLIVCVMQIQWNLGMK
jgi:hypothetical protein